MARRPSKAVVINRARFDKVVLAVADGMGDFARYIIESADPPDATPFGEGLVTRGGVLVYIGPKKVYGWSVDGRQPKKPRAFKVGGTKGIRAIAGFGFPARFQEFGTIKQPARPFLATALARGKPAAHGIIGASVKKVGG